jgi:hypothetical protein
MIVFKLREVGNLGGFKGRCLTWDGRGGDEGGGRRKVFKFG